MKKESNQYLDQEKKFWDLSFFLLSIPNSGWQTMWGSDRRGRERDKDRGEIERERQRERQKERGRDNERGRDKERDRKREEETTREGETKREAEREIKWWTLWVEWVTVIVEKWFYAWPLLNCSLVYAWLAGVNCVHQPDASSASFRPRLRLLFSLRPSSVSLLHHSSLFLRLPLPPSFSLSLSFSFSLSFSLSLSPSFSILVEELEVRKNFSYRPW